MKTQMTVMFVAFLAFFSISAGTLHADDAAQKKLLIGTWTTQDGDIVVIKKNGVMKSEGFEEVEGRVEKWSVSGGVFHTWLEKDGEKFKNNSYKIISLTETKFVLKDEAHGQHTGTWTR